MTIKDAHVAVDPYIVGAQFFADTTPNGTYDEGEPLSTLTNDKGEFVFNVILADGTPIILLDSVKGTHVGLPFEGLLKSSVDNIVATPLTTMVANGFTTAQIVNIISTAGITGITTDHLNVDPMLLFTDGDITSDDYSIMQGIIAVNTFLKMVGYGLNPDVLDENEDLTEPYATALQSSVALAKTAINSTYIDSGVDPKIVVYIGVAISNYLVDRVLEKEIESSGTGYLFLTQYLNDAQNNYENSDFISHINLLVAEYTADPTKFYAISSDGTSVTNTLASTPTSFTIDGYNFVQRFPDGDDRYLVDGNSISFDSDLSKATIITKKIDTENLSESRTGVRTVFDTAKKRIKASVKLIDADDSSQRVELTSYMFDKHSYTGIFASLSIREDKIYYYFEKDLYSDDYNTRTSVTLDGGDLDNANSYEGELVLASGTSHDSFSNLGIALVMYLNPDNGKMTLEAYDDSQALLASKEIIIPDYDKMNLGIDSSEIRVRVKSPLETTPEITTAYFAGFETSDLDYETTQTVADGDIALFSNSNNSWLDYVTFSSDTIAIKLYDYESSTDTYSYDGSENGDISITDSGTTIEVYDESTLTATCVNSETRKMNAYDGNVYSDLYRSLNTCTNAVSETDEHTWSWDWTNGDSNLDDISELVSVFTNGSTYFDESNVYFMLVSDNGTNGNVVLAEENGTWDDGSTKYIATSTVVGTWDSDADSINVDLSENYKFTKEFSLDINNQVVDSSVMEAGFVESDYIWTGSSVDDFFTDVTGFNLSSSVSNKQIKIEDTDGTWPSTMTFYANGKYTESGLNSDDGTTYNCRGLWKEFDDDAIGATCVESNISLPTPDKNPNTNGEIIFRLLKTLSTGSDVMTIEDDKETFPANIVAVSDAESFEDYYPAVGLGGSQANPASATLTVSGIDYTVKAYSSIIINSGSTDNNNFITVSGTYNGESFGFAISADYIDEDIYIVIYDDNGNEVFESVPFQAYKDTNDTLNKISIGAITVN